MVLDLHAGEARHLVAAIPPAPTHGPQADLFAADRWPRRPYCTEDLDNGLRRLSLAQALTRPYVQANPPHLRVWSIHDVDRSGAVMAWEDAHLPPPTWAAMNRRNGHAHLVWGLRAPVLVDGLGARDAPMRYLCAVESMMRERLQADQGYSGLITKNPAHPLWKVLRPSSGVLVYDLHDLAEYLPGIERHLPRGRRKPDETGLGRNVTLFDSLRCWSYRAIRQYWGGGLDGWNAWLSQCNSHALVRNADFPVPLDGREAWHIARSVAKWTWRNFSEHGFRAAQARRGRKGGVSSGQARRSSSEVQRVAAKYMADQGRSFRTIAGEFGVSPATISRWCKP